jgi:hypothetical protein
VYSDEDSAEADPLVFENPDGSLTHALPTGKRYKKAVPGTPPGDRLAQEWMAWDPELLTQISRLYGKHERIFLVLIFLQFLLENSFNALLIKHRTSTVHEILRTYPFMPVETGQVVFLVTIALAFGFAVAYYILATVAVWERKSRCMKIFSETAMIGILGQVMFAYINRFNLILFFLRFIVFAHSRFLLSILDGSARIIVTRRTTVPANSLPQDDLESVVIQV